MVDQREFKPKKINRNDLAVQKLNLPSPSMNHYFFVNVGRPWKWYSRLVWTYDQWLEWVTNKNVSTHIGTIQNTPFGYFELERQKEQSVEITFFGILPEFINRGLGGYLLSESIQAAWDLEAKRVWVHTCTLDHKYALNNYQARGFKIFKTDHHIEAVPEEDDEVWFTPNFYRTYRDFGESLLNDEQS